VLPIYRQLLVSAVLTSFIFSPLRLEGKIAESFPHIDPNAVGVENQLDFLTTQSKEILKERGSDALMRFMRSQANGGIDLRPLRQYAFNMNHGEPLAIIVDVHPDMSTAIDFANGQLKRSGIDFYEFKPHFDDTLEKPTEPFKADAASYKNWNALRRTLIPLVGFAACLIQAANEMSTTGNVSGAEMLPYIAQAVAILGLEFQFAKFSNGWNKRFWSDTRQGIAPMPERYRTKLNLNLSGLVNLVNQGISIINKGIPRGVQANHIYNLATNYLYAGTVYSVGMLVALASGNVGFKFGFINMLSASFLSTVIFFYGYGLTQILIGQFNLNGQISEYQRFRLESVGAYWSNLGRSISLIPGLESVGRYMMGAWGLFVTTPLIMRSMGAKKYAEHTSKIFESNRRMILPDGIGPCDKLLSSAFQAIRF